MLINLFLFLRQIVTLAYKHKFFRTGFVKYLLNTDCRAAAFNAAFNKHSNRGIIENFYNYEKK